MVIEAVPVRDAPSTLPATHSAMAKLDVLLTSNLVNVLRKQASRSIGRHCIAERLRPFEGTACGHRNTHPRYREHRGVATIALHLERHRLRVVGWRSGCSARRCCDRTECKAADKSIARRCCRRNRDRDRCAIAWVAGARTRHGIRGQRRFGLAAKPFSCSRYNRNAICCRHAKHSGRWYNNFPHRWCVGRSARDRHGPSTPCGLHRHAKKQRSDRPNAFTHQTFPTRRFR